MVIAVFVLFCSSFILEELNTCNAIPFDMRKLYIEILREKFKRKKVLVSDLIKMQVAKFVVGKSGKRK